MRTRTWFGPGVGVGIVDLERSEGEVAVAGMV